MCRYNYNTWLIKPKCIKSKTGKLNLVRSSKLKKKITAELFFLFLKWRPINRLPNLNTIYLLTSRWYYKYQDSQRQKLNVCSRPSDYPLLLQFLKIMYWWGGSTLSEIGVRTLCFMFWNYCQLASGPLLI